MGTPDLGFDAHLWRRTLLRILEKKTLYTSATTVEGTSLYGIGQLTLMSLCSNNRISAFKMDRGFLQAESSQIHQVSLTRGGHRLYINRFTSLSRVGRQLMRRYDFQRETTENDLSSVQNPYMCCVFEVLANLI